MRWVSDLGDAIYLSTEIEDGLDGSEGRLYRSAREELNWTLVSEGFSGFLLRAVSNLRRLPSGRLIGSLSGVFEGLQMAYSDDGGATWVEADATLGYWDIIRYGERLIAAEPWFYQPEARLMQSTDGVTWARLGGINAHDVVAASDGTLFAISMADLFRSVDEGTSWERVGTSAGSRVLAIDGEDYLYLDDGGVLSRSTQPVAVSAEREPERARLDLTVAPNPARVGSTVVLVLPEAAHARIEVVNLLGRVVATLRDGPLAAGTHTMRLKASLAAGAYVARMIAGDEVVTTRFVVAR
ncbi:MAG: T9SS type A sorting domain-containing protein [Bacteroidota bacterium]